MGKIKANELKVGMTFKMTGAGWLVAKTVNHVTQSNGKKAVKVFGEFGVGTKDENRCGKTYRETTMVEVK